MKWPKLTWSIPALIYLLFCGGPLWATSTDLAAPPPSEYDLREGSSLGSEFVGEDHAFMAQGLKSLLVLSAIILLAYFSLRLLKRFMVKTGSLSGNKQLKIISRTSLDQKNSLNIVQVNKRYFLLGVSEHNVSMLTELDPQDIQSPEEDKETVNNV